MSTIFQAECNEFLVTSVVKIISSTLFPAGSRARVTHTCLFVCFIVDVSQMRRPFPNFQGCLCFFRAAGAEKDESAEKSERIYSMRVCLRCFTWFPLSERLWKKRKKDSDSDSFIKFQHNIGKMSFQTKLRCICPQQQSDKQ